MVKEVLDSGAEKDPKKGESSDRAPGAL